MYHPAYKTNRKPILDPKFADERATWPKAESSKIFIFETICIVGQAKFGSDWTDAGLQALDWPVSPRQAHERSLLPASVNSGGGAPGGRPMPSIARRPSATNLGSLSELILKDANSHVYAYWTEGRVSAEQATWAENQKARERLFDAFEWLAQRCRDGEIIAHARLARGGSLFPMKSSEWNVENALQHFVSEGSFKRYFPEFNQSCTAYAFFDRAEIENAVAVFANAPATVSNLDLQSLSPYLRLAVKIALTKGYTSPECTDTQAVKEAEVRAAWQGAMPEIPQSQNAIEAIVKVMGFPNSKAILQGKAGKPGPP